MYIIFVLKLWQLKKLLTDAFDDLMDEEDDDDQSTVSSNHRNGYPGIILSRTNF